MATEERKKQFMADMEPVLKDRTDFDESLGKLIGSVYERGHREGFEDGFGAATKQAAVIQNLVFENLFPGA